MQKVTIRTPTFCPLLLLSFVCVLELDIRSYICQESCEHVSFVFPIQPCFPQCTMALDTLISLTDEEWNSLLLFLSFCRDKFLRFIYANAERLKPSSERLIRLFIEELVGPPLSHHPIRTHPNHSFSCLTDRRLQSPFRAFRPASLPRAS